MKNNITLIEAIESLEKKIRETKKLKAEAEKSMQYQPPCLSEKDFDFLEYPSYKELDSRELDGVSNAKELMKIAEELCDKHKINLDKVKLYISACEDSGYAQFIVYDYVIETKHQRDDRIKSKKDCHKLSWESAKQSTLASFDRVIRNLEIELNILTKYK